MNFSAEDLEKAGIQITGLRDAGEMLDEQARVAYSRRLSELREQDILGMSRRNLYNRLELLQRS